MDSNDPRFRGHEIMTNLKTEKGWAKEALLERMKESNIKNQTLYMKSESALPDSTAITQADLDTLGVSDNQIQEFQKQRENEMWQAMLKKYEDNDTAINFSVP